jgi:hypothetical protein
MKDFKTAASENRKTGVVSEFMYLSQDQQEVVAAADRGGARRVRRPGVPVRHRSAQFIYTLF